MREVDKPISEKTKAEIESKLGNMGDFVKMSYLQRALRSGLDLDTRRFILLRLAGIYEARKMYLDSAKMLKAAAEINTTFKDKIRDYMKTVELYVKSGDYSEAERIFSQTLALGNESQKLQMKNIYKNYYLVQGNIFLNNDRRNCAKIILEKSLKLNLDMQEKKEVQNKLLELYDRLGLIREFYNLKKSM